MRQKNLMVFSLAIVSALFLVPIVSAAQVTSDASITVGGISAGNDDVSVVAGSLVEINVYFTSDVNASDVKIKVDLEGEKEDVGATTEAFVVEEGKRIPKKTIFLKIPYELKDKVSEDSVLAVKIWNGDHRTELSYIVRVQRPMYSVDVMSISTSQKVGAGEILPVDVTVKNIGYNYINDMYITVKIPELGVERKAYFGDIVALECASNDAEYSCDSTDEDSMRGRVYLQIPYNAKAGIYNVEVEASNDDISISEVEKVIVENEFSSGNIIAVSNRKTASIGSNVVFELLVANPTNKLKVYRIVPSSSSDLSPSASENVIAVPAGSTKSVKVTANAASQGEHQFKVDLFSGEELAGTVALTANAEGRSITSPIVVITVILLIIFLVLLVVLIVMLGKKPEKTEEEFGESYY